MRRSLLLVLLLLFVLASACGDGSPSSTASDAKTAEAPGPACAPAVRDEFVRQQGLVHWQVYCPTQLPDGFRLARLDDPHDTALLGGDVSPTLDDLNPGGGTFITRLVGPQGAALVLVQGAGANIYTLRDDAGVLITDDKLSDAPFGDIAGKLYPGKPARVTAIDAQSFGHMLISSGVDAEVVAQLAAAMRPVDPPLATVTASSAEAIPSPTPDPAVRARVLQGLPVAPFPSNFHFVPYDWSPDGRRIAFIGEGLALYIAEPPTYTPQLLAGGPASEPRWSPEGKLIAFDAGGAESNTGDGIQIVSPDRIGGGAAQPVSPVDDQWRGRILQIYRWLDEHTIAYDAHCGSGCQMLFEMTVERPTDGSAPRAEGVVRQVPFVRNCADCIAAGLTFHYSPDGRYVVAETGTMPALAWYERANDAQWLVTFGDDPSAVEIFREFLSWDADSRTFAYRESIGTSPFADPPPLWLYWRADPLARTRTPIPAQSNGKPTGDPALDHLIGATLVGDRDALVADIGYTKLGCVRPQQLGTPPGCLESEADGTLVDSFLIAGCDGAYQRPDFAEQLVRNVPLTARLLAVGSPSPQTDGDGTQYVLLFAYDESADSTGFWWAVRDGKIIGYHQPCGSAADALPVIMTSPRLY